MAAPLPDPWDDHPDHPMSDWRYEVSNGDTLRGYRDWVAAKIKEESEHEALHAPEGDGRGPAGPAGAEPEDEAPGVQAPPVAGAGGQAPEEGGKAALAVRVGRPRGEPVMGLAKLFADADAYQESEARVYAQQGAEWIPAQGIPVDLLAYVEGLRARLGLGRAET